jgi:two-component system chemotaxis sensor kinase CheA
VAALTGKPPDPTPVLDATALPAPKPAPPTGALGLPPRFAVRVRIAHTCQVPGVRAFLVHKKLSGLGTIHGLKPSLEELKAGRIPEGMIFLELEAPAGEAGIQQG